MAGSDSYYFQPPETPTQSLFSPPQPNQHSPSKLYSHFLYKSLLVAVLVILPLFPSQTPDFINQTIFTRSWELLHLLFVGIAVSYGLFSRRNAEPEKENRPQIENTQTYVARILQVSSLFDEEPENLSGFEDNKTQTWNSRYFRYNPVVLEWNDDSALDHEQRNCSGNKHLLLPVRSLRSRVSQQDALDSDEALNINGSSSSSLSRSASRVKRSRSGSEARRGNIGSLDPVYLEEKLNGSPDVLPSPIPWCSRSARTEPPRYSLRPSNEESNLDPPDSRSFRRAATCSSRANSTSPSPNNLFSFPPPLPELRAKKVDDMGKKFYKPPPPPPPPPRPPPPPPPLPPRRIGISPSITPTGSSANHVFSSQKRNFENELKDLSRNTSKDVSSNGKLRLDPLKSEAQSKANIEVSTLRKLIRTIGESAPVVETREVKEFRGDQKNESMETGVEAREDEAVFMEKKGNKTGGFHQPSMRNRRVSFESKIPTTFEPRFSRYQAEKDTKEFADEKVIVESDDDSDSDIEENQGSSEAVAATTNTVNNEGVDLNEVDKKADEFIAKFREQIRLQRIESIKKSSRQHNIRKST